MKKVGVTAEELKKRRQEQEAKKAEKEKKASVK